MELSNSFDDYVICPYDKSHNVLRGRLTIHLQRCARNSDKSNRFGVCPYNFNHRFDKKELHTHIENCPDKLSIESLTFTATEPQPVQLETAKCEESWDEEPNAPTYDPTAYCMQNLVIRATASNGLSKSERRKLRDAERRRFAEHQ